MHCNQVILSMVVAASLLTTVAFFISPAGATFPGRNGRILFVSGRDGNLEIYDMKKNGCSPQNLSVNDADDSAPSISADASESPLLACGTGMQIFSR
jgi:hypothetical protein